MLKDFLVLVLTNLLVLTLSESLFASGGPIDSQVVDCIEGKATSTIKAMVRLKIAEAYSSEIKGHATVYRDHTREGAVLSSMSVCREIGALADFSALDLQGAHLFCGVEIHNKVSKKLELRHTRAGYRVLVWLNVNRVPESVVVQQIDQTGQITDLFGRMHCQP
jgi:hypothetical protein